MGFRTAHGMNLYPGSAGRDCDNPILFLVVNMWIRESLRPGTKFSDDDIKIFLSAIALNTHYSHDNLIAKYSGLALLGLHGRAAHEYNSDKAKGRFKDEKPDQPGHRAFYIYCCKNEPSCIQRVYLKGMLSVSNLYAMPEKHSEIQVAWVMLRTMVFQGRFKDLADFWEATIIDKGGMHKVFESYYKAPNHPNREDSEGLVF